MLAKVITWAGIGVGLFASTMLLNRPILIVIIGILAGFLTPIIVEKFAPGPPPVAYSPQQTNSNWLRSTWYGIAAFVAACGVVLLWIGWGEYSMFAQRPGLVASMIYSSGLCWGAAGYFVRLAQKVAMK